MSTEKVFVDANGQLHYDSWVTLGTMMYNRECLAESDPNQLYNYLTSCGVEPENYGIEHPLVEEFKDYTRSQIIQELVALRRELLAYQQAGF
jgi:hypothetical protein